MSTSTSNIRIKNDLVAKLLIIGDSKVGKSSLLTRFTDNLFSSQTTTTVGIDYKTKRIKIEDTEIKLQIWDTAGQERYRSIAQNFYKNAMGVLIVFDLTDEHTFNNVRNWVRQTKNNAGENVCRLLIGNKADLKENRAVQTADINELVEDLNLKYFEVSAKSGENVNEAFMHISKEIKKTFFPNAKPEGKNENTQTLKTTKRAKDDSDASRGCC